MGESDAGRDDELERLRARVRELEASVVEHKLEAVAALAGGIAHDFNNYLMIIGANAELIDMGLAPKDPGHNLVEEILSTTDRCHLLIKRMLAFSFRQEPRPKAFVLDAFLAEFGKTAKGLLKGKVELAVEPGAEAAEVFADRAQVEQILINLVVNARDAMPDGGLVRISSAAVELDADTAGALELEPGAYLAVRVGDTGVGIPEAIRERIFEPFFTTKPKGKGAGLGLSTTLTLVRDGGGGLRIESNAGQGTRVEVLLPVAPAVA